MSYPCTLDIVSPPLDTGGLRELGAAELGGGRDVVEVRGIHLEVRCEQDPRV